MAQRLNCIEFAFPQNEANLALATRFDFASMTLYAPETASRTFRSVIVEITCRDTVTVAASMTSWLIGIKLGAAAFDDVTVTDTIGNSGEQQSFMATRDVTSYFNTNFGSGASQTCQVGVQFGALAVGNITARLYITYEFDDASQDTMIKTVRIPIESNTGALTTSLVSIGSNQIPNLDTFLPETSKVYRDIFFVVEGNESTGGTTDYTHRLALDAEGADDDLTHENGLNSSVWYRRIWKRTDMTTNATHDIKSSVSSTGGSTHNHQAVLLVVTYEYSEDNSTSIMNSVMIPMDCRDLNILGGTATGDKSRFEAKFFIEEPATVALVQSGVYISWVRDTSGNLSVAAGSQTARSYTGAAGSLTCGGFNVMHRIDSGGAQGAGISIARGENTFTLDLFSSNITNPHGLVGACLYLNYTSGKSTQGAPVHNRTSIWHIGMSLAADVEFRKSATDESPIIPETEYWLTSLGYYACLNQPGGIAAHMASMGAERQSGELEGAGWEVIFNGLIPMDAERGLVQAWGDLTTKFDRHPGEPQARMAVETDRSHVITTYQFGHVLAYQYLTYHSIKFTADDLDIDGYADADGAGLVLNVFRTDTGERLYQFTSGASGVTDTVIYDNVLTYAAEIHEDSTHVGRSPNFSPSGSP